MIQAIVNNPKISHEEVKKLAIDVVLMLSKKNMTYEKAWLILDTHKKVIDEAIARLNHNAGIEMKKNPIKYVLSQ